MAKAKVAVEEIENPYKEIEKNRDDVKAKHVAAKVSTKCLERGTGVMFKLFDLGNLSFKGTQLYVYKNKVGDAIRFFIKMLDAGVEFEKSFNELTMELLKIARLSCSEQEQYDLFAKSINETVLELREIAND